MVSDVWISISLRCSILVSVFSADENLEFVRQAIQQAVDDWESRSCVTFPQRTAQAHYILISNSGGCSSFIGDVRSFSSPQPINLAYSGCFSVSHLLYSCMNNGYNWAVELIYFYCIVIQKTMILSWNIATIYNNTYMHNESLIFYIYLFIQKCPKKFKCISIGVLCRL